MKNPALTFLKYVNIWTPVIMAGVVSYIALGRIKQGDGSMPWGFPAFFSFLPMAFFFSASAMQQHTSRLEKRVEELEKKTGIDEDVK